MKPEKYDFSGWATKNNIVCSDGRVIQRDAFKDQDGTEVPLVWNHMHGDPSMVLGIAYLENRPEGVYVYGSFNNNEKSRDAKEAMSHGEIKSLSIWANRLVENGNNVAHGTIREVSLVLAGANPGAYIDSILKHSFIEDDEAIFCMDDPLELYHSDEDKKDDDKKEESSEKKSEDDKTLQDVVDTFNEEQKKVFYALLMDALEQGDKSEEKDSKEDSEMKQNAFDQETKTQNSNGVICHADQEAILDAAKKQRGSFRSFLNAYIEDHELQHDDTAGVSGFTSYPSGATPAGVDLLFPEYHNVRSGAPELITDDTNWVSVVLNKVHKSPFSRIRTSQVDIRNIAALRARGYKKGTQKEIAGNYALVKRETDPQTVYVKSALNRDDIVDITDFDYVDYQYKIDRAQLNEELATAILLGDGREDDADGKIDPVHIRPIYGDDALYTIYQDLGEFTSDINGDFSDNFGENYKYAEGVVAAVLNGKIDFRGTGKPDMFCTQEFVNKMLLARDLNGRRLYKDEAELATTIGVGNIYPVSKMSGLNRTKGSGQTAKTMNLDAIIVNLADYSLGSTKGGQITHFTQFDIDFNQEKSLLETRVSGAPTRIKSAIVIEEERVSSGS